MSEVIGQGRLVLTNSAAPGNVRYFGLEISQLRIQFYDLLDNAQFTGLNWWQSVEDTLVPRASTVQIPGHIILSALPATPSPAFTDISVSTGTISGSEQLVFSITIRQATPFASSASGHITFQDLDITFTETDSGVTVSGGVKVVLFNSQEQLVTLTPAWDNGKLVFKAIGHNIPVGQVGVIENTQIAVQALDHQHPWESLQVLYALETHPGNMIRDVSGQSPIDLNIYTPDRVSWAGGALMLQKDAAIATAPLDAKQPLPPPRATQRLIQACQETQEISVVLWIEPDEEEQNGPARLVTLSSDASERNFLVGQENDRYVVRLRTSLTDVNGRLNGKNILESPKESVQLEPTCLVFTRSASGSNDTSGESNAHLYINGQLVDSTNVGGDFSNWEAFELSLANEFKDKKRSWEGEFYRVAIYNKPLTPEQVRQLYYPNVLTTGDLKLTDMPAPLDQTLPTVIAYDNDFSLIQAATTTPRLATPQFQFDQISLAWKKVSTQPWALQHNDSAVEATLWQQNKFTLGTKNFSENQPEQFLPLIPQPHKPLQLILKNLGEITVADFELQPSTFNDRPQWKLIADVRDAEIDLPELDRSFDFKTDFKLTDLDLVIKFVDDPLRAVADDRVLLTGKWLRKSLGFYGVSIGEQFLLRSATLFQLPFNLTLGPIHEPGTTLRIADQVSVCPAPGCREIISLDTLIELSGAGFIAIVNGMFPWEDRFGRRQVLSIPEFTTFTLPTTPNSLLAQATEQLRHHADTIFAPVIQSEQDFYVVNLDTQSTVVYEPEEPLIASSGNMFLTTVLPPVLSQDKRISTSSDGSAKNQFELQQAGTEAHLSVSISALEELERDYIDFLGLLSNEVNSPYSFELIRRRLAERLPVPVNQGLRYAYGYSTGRRVDLLGGMRLRVEYQNYQFVHPVDRTADNGFISSGVAYYSLNFNIAEGYLGFDPFISAVPAQLETDNQTVASLIDLLHPGYRKPFYRLVYPDKFVSDKGRLGRERVAALIGANTFSSLEQATTNFLNSSESFSSDVALVFFRGRATVVPEIAVFVQEQPLYVSMGTTIRQLAERYGQAGLRGRPQRLVHEGVNNAPDYRFVNLGDLSNALDLPLMQGDRIYF